MFEHGDEVRRHAITQIVTLQRILVLMDFRLLANDAGPMTIDCLTISRDGKDDHIHHSLYAKSGSR